MANLQHDVPGERVAVGAKAARGERDECVTVAHAVRPQLVVTLDHTDREAREVELVRCHHAGVLGGLAAEQRAADLEARRVDARHELGDLVGIEQADRDVVEEDDRLGPRAHEVVHAHRDEVLSDAPEPVEGTGDLELRAHPVGRRDEHRVAPPPLAHGEPPRESADRAQHPRSVAGSELRGDPPHGLVACGDVDSGSGVGGGRTSRHAFAPVVPRTTSGTRVGYRPVRHASQNPASGAPIASTRSSKAT